MKYLAKLLLLPLAIKVLVDVGLPYYCDNGTPKLPNPAGPNVCVRLDLYPFGLDARSVTEAGARTALNGTTWCTAVQNLVIARALAEYSVTIVDTEIVMRGCKP